MHLCCGGANCLLRSAAGMPCAIERCCLGTTSPLDRPDQVIELVAVTHLHVGNALVRAGENFSRPELGVVNDLAGFVFTIAYRGLRIAFRLQDLPDRLFRIGLNRGA